MEQISAILRNIETEFLNDLEVKLKAKCDDILKNAVNFRRSSPNAHDITGNLITGILVALFRKGKMKYAIAPEDSLGLAPPIRPQMTSPLIYHFKTDYSGTEAFYRPDVVAKNKEYAMYRAFDWLRHSYKTSKDSLFEIVVVYGADYAEWLEHERGTAGFADTVAYIRSIDWGNGIKTF
jgi:hypothetical protein